MLPADLRSAEDQALEALRAALGGTQPGRWTVEFRFEGLRLLPLAIRCCERLLEQQSGLRLLFPDAGAAALARRDAPALSAHIGSFSEQRRRPEAEEETGVLVLVAASQAEYEEVEALCGRHRGAVVLINPALEDAAVGIGSVARQRRRGFLAGWEAAYAVMPLEGSALRRAWPGPWELYRLDPDGYRPVATFERRPDAEQQQQALTGGDGSDLGSQLRSLEGLFEGLRR
jgi:hypothetical protein